MTIGNLFYSAFLWQSSSGICQGAPLAGTALFSVFACSAFGAPFLHDFIPLHKSFFHPTSAMCRPFPRSLNSYLPNRPAAEKVRHNGIVVQKHFSLFKGSLVGLLHSSTLSSAVPQFIPTFMDISTYDEVFHLALAMSP